MFSLKVIHKKMCDLYFNMCFCKETDIITNVYSSGQKFLCKIQYLSNFGVVYRNSRQGSAMMKNALHIKV